MSLEAKSVLSDVLMRIVRKLFDSIVQPKAEMLIKEKYVKGIEEMGVKLQMNFIPDDKDLLFLQDYVRNTLKFHTDALGDELRQEIERGVLNDFTKKDIKKRIREVFKEKKYLNRLEMVLRTEGMRANHQGQFQAAKQSGLVIKKWISIVRDGRNHPVSLAMSSKYGSPEQAIPLDQEFSVKIKGEVIKGLYPPFHPNDRDIVRFVRE